MAGISEFVPGRVSSTPELLAIAHAMETEAARRYRELAARMRLRDNAALAELFTFLSGIEQKHASQIDTQAVKLMGRTVDPAILRWELPENFDEEEASSRLLTPYLALAIAVRNEERSFSFYCYVAAEAASAEVRAFAEELAKEELEHATLLRRERRKAYRQGGGRDRTSGLGNMPGSVEELLTIAVDLEAVASRYHAALATKLEPTDPAAAQVFAEAAADEMETVGSASSRLDVSPRAASFSGTPAIEDGLRILEEVFEFYTDVAERSGDEEVVLEAQALAERAVRRLSLTYGRLPQRTP